MDAMPNRGLTPAQRESFEENGFLAIEQLLDDDDLAPLEAEYEALLDRLAHSLKRSGDIPSAYGELAFAERFCRILEHVPGLHRHFNISLPLINGPVDPQDFDMHRGPAVFGLLRNAKILDAVESILGPEIVSCPVQQMRMKPPERRIAGDLSAHSNVGRTTWHQDIVALLPDADDSRILTCWVAITDASEENGCLVSDPGQSPYRGRWFIAPMKSWPRSRAYRPGCWRTARR